jgi:hypothetical protein
MAAPGLALAKRATPVVVDLVLALDSSQYLAVHVPCGTDNDYCVETNLQVPCHSVLQDLIDEVHQLFFLFCLPMRQIDEHDNADYCIGCSDVEQ